MAFKIGQLVGNRYRILRHYSSGGMSETYLAEDTLLRGQRVALETRRLFSERQRQQVQREVSLLQSFNHPNIRHLLDYGRVLLPLKAFSKALPHKMMFVMSWAKERVELYRSSQKTSLSLGNCSMMAH